MKQFLAILYKEALLISRDRAGLALLFVMPVMFLLIMSVAQDSVYKSVTELGMPVILVDNDQDSLGHHVNLGLEQTEFCKLSTTLNGKKPTVQEAHEAVARGDFMFGVIIPENATASIRKSVENLVSQTIGLDSNAQSANIDKVEVEIIYDPTTQKSMVTTVSSTLREFISNLKAKIIFETFTGEIKDFIPSTNSKINLAETDVIQFSEEFANNSESKILPNSVQHNVPAWTIFGIFFIVVPLAGSIIKEKQEGSSIRLKTLPGPYVLNHLGKMVVYFAVTIIQFILMMSLAKLLLPLIGLPVLQFGGEIPAVIVIAIGLSLAATGFGMFVGTICTTYQQAAIGGSLTILILAALGGIWVPLHIMPEYMQIVSKVSPLNWGLEAFYTIFLRGQGFPLIWPYVISLFSFFVLTITLTVLIVKMRRS